MKSKWIVILFASLFIMSSCSSYKNVPYLQNPEVVNELKKELPLCLFFLFASKSLRNGDFI